MWQIKNDNNNSKKKKNTPTYVLALGTIIANTLINIGVTFPATVC